MIDFHTHILNNMDDGAENLQISIQLVNSLIKQGVNEIVLTPHFYFNKISADNFLFQRKNKLTELEEIFKGQDIKFIPACEVYISKAKLTDNLNKFAIKGTQYILIELPFKTNFTKNFLNDINNIIDYTGLTPIVVHAERYPALQKAPSYINTLISEGCLIQLNTDSLFNQNTKRLAYKMLEKNQVHFLGSDCHNIDKRPPVYEKAMIEIIKSFGEEYFLKLQQNMRDVLDNKQIHKVKSKPIRKIFNYYY